MPNVKAEMGRDRTVVYTDEKGTRTIHSGGSRPWRNNNPGAITWEGPNGFAARHGAIGHDDIGGV